MGNSATSKVIGEETMQFRSHDGCITTLQGVRYVPESRYNLISLGALHREGFCFSLKGDLMEVFKEAHVMFQAERIGKCVYVAEFGGYSWWIAVILGFKIGGCGTIGDYDGFEIGCSIVPRREIGTRRATR